MAKHIRHTPNFKAKAAMAAIKENKTIAELSQELKVSRIQIARWKAIAVERLGELFEDGRYRKNQSDVDVEALYAQIGKLQAKLEFLKKKTGVEE